MAEGWGDQIQATGVLQVTAVGSRVHLLGLSWRHVDVSYGGPQVALGNHVAICVALHAPPDSGIRGPAHPRTSIPEGIPLPVVLETNSGRELVPSKEGTPTLRGREMLSESTGSWGQDPAATRPATDHSKRTQPYHVPACPLSLFWDHFSFLGKSTGRRGFLFTFTAPCC